ncbi:MAG TPA: type II CAAX endopeptidase family protein [Chitinophagaceae bacterium]|nr:type II CAAX endopeptidase family protein [Chitinophagaceae bacterium]
MQKPNLAAWILLIASIFIVKIVLVEGVLGVRPLETEAGKIKATVVGIALIIGTALIARRAGLLHYGGFLPKQQKAQNYLLLLLPIVYPGGFYLARADIYGIADPAAGLTLLTAITAGAMLEETAFRGLLQGYLLKHYPKKSVHWSCLVTATVFAICHFSNLRHDAFPNVFQQVLYAFAMGLLFSALLLRIGNVWALGFVHGFVNFLSAAGGGQPTESGTRPFLEQLVAVGGFLLVLLPVVLVYWLLVILRPVKEKSSV